MSFVVIQQWVKLIGFCVQESVKFIFSIRLRNTPTHVGNTISHRRHVLGVQKHPHACGEYHLMHTSSPKEIETPPRMWGIQRFVKIYEDRDRNTPTHVGNTIPPRQQSLLTGKHPHACGEYSI